MRFSFRLSRIGSIFCFTLLFLFAGCRKSVDTFSLGTYRMGEIVQAGPLSYQVFEAHWNAEVPGVTVKPTDRFLVVSVEVTNNSADTVNVPAFTLVGTREKTIYETTKGVTDAANWLGMLRSLESGKKLKGVVLFDAPIGSYKLAVSDGGDIANEKHAYIEIPANLG